jgi:hypothetical protein
MGNITNLSKQNNNPSPWKLDLFKALQLPCMAFMGSGRNQTHLSKEKHNPNSCSPWKLGLFQALQFPCMPSWGNATNLSKQKHNPNSPSPWKLDLFKALQFPCMPSWGMQLIFPNKNTTLILLLLGNLIFYFIFFP